MKTGGFWRRGLARLTGNPSRAIYGTIVATAVTAAAGDNEPLGAVAEANAVTLVVFWIAHVYSAVLEHRYRGTQFRIAVVPRIMSEELPLVEAPALAIAILLLGALGAIPGGLAITLALASGVAQLLVWGAVAARRSGLSWPATAVASAVDGALGLLIIGLKTILH